MKTTEPTFRDHLDKDVTALCTCWEIRRKDGAVLRFTDSDQDVVHDGNTYQSIGAYSRSAIESTSSLSVDNLEVSGMATDLALPVEELRAGAYDHAEVEVFMTSWMPSVAGKVKLRRGFFGEVRVLPNGTFTVELRGLLQRLAHTYTDVFSATCRHDLGDDGCGINLNHPFIAEGAHIPIPYSDANFEEVGSVGLGASHTWYNPINEEDLIDSGATYSGSYAARGSDLGGYLVQDIDLYQMSDDFRAHVDQGFVGFNAFAWRKDYGDQGRIRYQFFDNDFRQLRLTSGSYYSGGNRINIPETIIAGDWTFEAWVKPAEPWTPQGNYDRQGEIFGYNDGNQRIRSLRIDRYTDTLTFLSSEPNDGFQTIFTAHFEIPEDEWGHVALVREGDTTIICYINGKEVARAETWTVNHAAFYAEAIAGGYIYNWDGTFDEVRIWTEARSQALINQERFRDISEAPPTLIRYYPFDGNTEDWGINETGPVTATSGGVLQSDYSPVAVAYRGIETELDSGFQDVGTSWTLVELSRAAIPMNCRYIRLIFDHFSVAGTAAGTRMDSVFGWFTDAANTVSMPNFSVGSNEDIWTRAGMVTTGGSNRIFNANIDEPRKSQDGWFQGGLVTFYSGKNAGASMEIKRWTASSNQIELFLSLPYPVEQGDLFTIYPGCDKSRVCCVALFENIENFFGTPDIPGEDELFRYPDYKD